MNRRARTIFDGLGKSLWMHGLVAGLLFTLILSAGLAFIPLKYFQARDDGIITLSHARNWVDYGFIGVNPSGERVEGYSAPFQLGLYSLAYGLGRLDFNAFFQAQFFIFTFLLGLAIFVVNRETSLRAIWLTAGAGMLLIFVVPFLEWQASGMENAITHFLLAVSILILWQSIRVGRVWYWTALVLFLASIARAESIYYILPLMVVYTVGYWVENRSARGMIWTGLVLIQWTVYQVVRYAYFGSLFPNTANAQGISVFDNLARLVSFAPAYLAKWSGPAWQTFLSSGGALLLLAFPLLFFVKIKRNDAFLILALMTLTALTFLNPFIFGETRLDPLRASTQIAVFAALFIAYLVNRLKLPWGGAVLALAVIAGMLILPGVSVRPYDLCCGIDEMEQVRQTIATFALENKIARPTIANPDLGAMSWHKQFNIVDLGGLGSPLLVRLTGEPRIDYFMLAAPDIVEAHAMWSYIYSTLLLDPRFRAAYVQVQDLGSWKNVAEYPQGIWVRNDILWGAPSAERRFLDDLQASLNLDRILREYEDALRSGLDTTYVSRTVYRFLPEISRANEYDQLIERLTPLNLPGFDRYLLTGLHEARAYELVIAELQAEN